MNFQALKCKPILLICFRDLDPQSSDCRAAVPSLQDFKDILKYELQKKEKSQNVLTKMRKDKEEENGN